MNTAVRTTLLLLLALATILIWQKPASAPAPAHVRITAPSPPLNGGSIQPEQQGERWRVVTRRVISKDAIRSLKRRLHALGLQPITIRHQEEVVLHAFDDSELFTSQREAWLASKVWRDHGIEVSVIQARKDLYMVGLGRFYQENYAEGMQKRLTDVGRKFRYQQRTVPVPTWRFSFPATSKTEAEKLWRKLNRGGVIMPVVMPETAFRKLYGSVKPE